MAWRRHNYAECNIMKWRKETKKNIRASLPLFFLEGDGTYVKEQLLYQCVYYWWLKKQGRAAHWSSRGLWRKSLLVLVSFMRLIGNGKLGRPK